MADTLVEVEAQLAQVRSETGRRAWLVSRVRERCLKNNVVSAPAPRLLRSEGEVGENPEVLKIEAYLLAQRFHALPEPERSALALFYVDLFNLEELAQILKMSVEVLSETLGAARALLKESLNGMRSGPSSSV